MKEWITKIGSALRIRAQTLEQETEAYIESIKRQDKGTKKGIDLIAELLEKAKVIERELLRRKRLLEAEVVNHDAVARLDSTLGDINNLLQHYRTLRAMAKALSLKIKRELDEIRRKHRERTAEHLQKRREFEAKMRERIGRK